MAAFQGSLILKIRQAIGQVALAPIEKSALQVLAPALKEMREE